MMSQQKSLPHAKAKRSMALTKATSARGGSSDTDIPSLCGYGSLTGVARFGKPLNRTVKCVHAAAPRGGDVQRVEPRAAEGAAGRVLRRHLDHPVDLACRRVAHHARAAVLGVPQAALGVDARAVGEAGMRRGEEALVSHLARVGVV